MAPCYSCIETPLPPPNPTSNPAQNPGNHRGLACEGEMTLQMWQVCSETGKRHSGIQEGQGRDEALRVGWSQGNTEWPSKEIGFSLRGHCLQLCSVANLCQSYFLFQIHSKKYICRKNVKCTWIVVLTIMGYHRLEIVFSTQGRLQRNHQRLSFEPHTRVWPALTKQPLHQQAPSMHDISSVEGILFLGFQHTFVMYSICSILNSYTKELTPLESMVKDGSFKPQSRVLWFTCCEPQKPRIRKHPRDDF